MSFNIHYGFHSLSNILSNTMYPLRVKARDCNLVALFVCDSCLFCKINTRTRSNYCKFLIISNLNQRVEKQRKQNSILSFLYKFPTELSLIIRENNVTIIQYTTPIIAQKKDHKEKHNKPIYNIKEIVIYI